MHQIRWKREAELSLQTHRPTQHGKAISEHASIVACYLTYNSIDTVERSLDSAIDLVDSVVVVDGAFIGMLGEDHSSDCTVDVVKSIVGKKGIIIQPRERLTELQSKNLWLQQVTQRFPDGWMFWIDADEVLHDAVNDFKWLRGMGNKRYQVAHFKRVDPDPYRWYGFSLYTSLRDRTPFHPRLYGGIPGLHFAENHWFLRDKWGDRVEPKYTNITFREAWLEHLRGTRKIANLDAVNYFNTYERWKYEKNTRPLKSYIPYPLVKTTKNIFRRGKIPAERYLNFLYANTYGSQTRN